jgi:D-alanyl-D-alanine carboxypeptidase (penicillin-binding protein 5/6)
MLRESTFCLIGCTMKKLGFCLLYLLNPLVGAQLDVQVRAASAILMNAETGSILFEKHAYTPSNPASTTKIATALYVLDKQIDLNQLATVSKEAIKGRPINDRDKLPAYWLDSDGTMMQIRLGEILSFDMLLHGMMLVSGNDAANVVAEHIGGTIPQFMDLLNEYLQSIGCHQTKFSNPHGLTHHQHWSTAYDLARMTCKALKIPKFREIISTLSYTLPKTNKQPERELKLTNPLLKPKSRYYYPKAIGVKSGYTFAAKQNLVAAAEYEGRTLIAVLLGCEQREDRFEDAKKLFEMAFAEEKKTRRLIGPESIFEKELKGLKRPLKAAVMKPISISFFPAEEPNCKAAIYWEAPVLPIRKGQKVGEVHVLNQDGSFLQKGDLVALEEIKPTLWEKIFQFIR